MTDTGYGLWWLVGVNTLVFGLFAVSFFHPQSRRDWRAMGAFWAFLAALFTEMYGYPLTVYLLSGWLGSWFPALQGTHAGGHLWNDLIGWKGDPHVSPFHLASYVFVGGGFWLIASAWRVLWSAARDGRLATTGAYAHVRHPQYAGFLLIMIGFLLQCRRSPPWRCSPSSSSSTAGCRSVRSTRSASSSERNGTSTRRSLPDSFPIAGRMRAPRPRWAE